MIEAIKAENISKIEELIAQGVQVNYINNSCASSAIEAATKLNNIEIVTLLLSVKNADPNQWYMRSPLAIAIDNEFLDIADLLIEHGADVNINPDMDMTPLMCAVSINNLQLVKRLIDAGADVNAAGKESNPPLSIAASSGYKEIYEYLLPLINKNYLQEFIEEAIWCAIIDNSLAGIIFLSSIDANMNCRNFNGNTPLIEAIECGNFSMAETLIEIGVNVNLKNNNNRTALSISREKDYDEVAQKLLEAGATEE
ncbi:ankyrin repeat domain-containing protein [Baaleninema simplex]|uniref:ankyrin repeat domain-containing protein n=1 Tax=Baaleninema simplex TaxID=2862350 RepID=UPI001C552AAB|nr:ankyrin repeat domain-containing protein [Baaleninema simplex]